MITKISEEGWKKAYYEKWLPAQERTRRKVKWNDYTGWNDLQIGTACSYCKEPNHRCSNCSLKEKDACGTGGGYGKFFDYVSAMRASLVDWKLANSLVDQIVEAIRLDGVEWGYIKKEGIK